MSDGCQCEYLSERAGGAPVVCQYCHDVAKAEIKRLRAALDAPPKPLPERYDTVAEMVEAIAPAQIETVECPMCGALHPVDDADPREAFEAWFSPIAWKQSGYVNYELTQQAFLAGFAVGRAR